MRRRSLLCIGAMALALAAISACGTQLRIPAADFEFRNWGGPPIPVRLHVPQSVSDNSRIVFVMHGASRDVIRYFNDWQPLAEKYGLVIVVPEFSADAFNGSRRYNLGWVYDKVNGQEVRRPENLWTFSAIEPLFDEIVERLGGTQTHYSMYGHSAGSQFVHRFLYFKPAARVERFVAANAGWYTLPVRDEPYPYGLSGSGIAQGGVESALGKAMTLLLGTADNDPNASKLRHTEEAERQGPHRLARGRMMYESGRNAARALGTEFNWTLQFVEDANHSNAKMAPAAAAVIAN